MATFRRCVLILKVLFISCAIIGTFTGCMGTERPKVSMADISMKLSSKKVHDNNLSKCNRIIINTEVSKPHAFVHGKAHPVGTALGNTIFYGSIVGDLLAKPPDHSSKYINTSIIKSPNYQESFKERIEASLQPKLKQPMVVVAGPLKYRSDIKLNPNDGVVHASLFLFFTGVKAQANLEAILSWEVSSSGTNYQEVTKNLEAFYNRPRGFTLNPNKYSGERKLIMDQYDGYGNLVYKSKEYSEEEWLANDSRLMEEEVLRAINNLADQLGRVLLAM